MSLIGATLGLPFVSKFIVYSDATHKMEIKQNLPVQLVSVFGVGLCLYAYYALRDIRFHVARNWTRANYARTDEWKEVTMQHDKKFGWNVLMVIGSFAFLAFVSLFLITFPAVRPTFAWCCNL